MPSLLNDCAALRSRLATELPDGPTRDEALLAFDSVEACVRLAEGADVKAAADMLARMDVDTLRPVERDAWKALALARVAATVESAVAEPAILVVP